MSSFIRRTKNPKTEKFEDAEWLDNYFGARLYGVRFPDGKVYNADKSTIEWEFDDHSSQQPSTVELEVLYDRIRAGKVPGTDDLHITRSEFVAAINELRRQDMEYVIGKKFDVNQYLVKYGDGEIAYHLGEASVSVTDVLKLRADQRKRLEERLNEPE